MSLTNLHSALAEPIRHFVNYKRALNRKPYFLVKMEMGRPTTRHSSGVSTSC
jgi:hypothetical protein